MKSQKISENFSVFQLQGQDDFIKFHSLFPTPYATKHNQQTVSGWFQARAHQHYKQKTRAKVDWRPNALDEAGSVRYHISLFSLKTTSFRAFEPLSHFALIRLNTWYGFFLTLKRYFLRNIFAFENIFGLHDLTTPFISTNLRDCNR